MTNDSGQSLLRTLERRTRCLVFANALQAAGYGGLLVFVSGYALLVFARFWPQHLFFKVSKPAWLTGLVLVAVATPALLTFLSQWRNSKWLTRMLERKCPQLGDRLLSAVELGASRESRDAVGRLLKAGLESETCETLQQIRPGALISIRRVLLPFFCILFGAALCWGQSALQPEFFGTAWRLMSGGGAAGGSGGAGKGMPGFQIQVAPGSVEIAKNSSLEVQAGTPGHTIRKAEIYIQAEGENGWQIFAMQSQAPESVHYPWTHVVRPAVYFVRVDGKDSASFRVLLSEALTAEDIRWEIRAPEYTHTPPQIKQGWFEKISVPEASRIHLKFKMSSPVSAGCLRFKGKKFAELTPVSESELAADFFTLEKLILVPEISDLRGRSLTGLSPVVIQTVPDLPPYIEVLEPQIQNYVFPTEEVPFVLSVNDDYGLSSVKLILQYKGRTERLEWLAPEARGKRELSLAPVLELEKFILGSRDLMFAYVEVQDNYPGEPAQIARSSLLTFMVRDYVEQFKINLPPPDQPSLRSLFEDILSDQTDITREVWDYLSLFETEKSFSENQKESSGETAS